MGRFAKLLVITLSVVVFCYVSIGFVLGQSTTQQRPYRSLTVFTEVLAHIQQDYVEDPNMPLVTAGAMHGLLEALDPQSGYLAPQEYAEYRKRADRPAKGDVGLALSKRFGYAAVVSVLPDSSAARAGVHAGDIIENIGGFTTREMSAGHARMLLAGDLDTSVRISVLRSGRTEPQDIDLVRVAPVVPRLAFEKLSLPGAAGADSGVAYLRVPSFGAGRAEELRARLTQLEKQGLRRLVLDLRDSAIGDISEAVAAAQLFLDRGTIVSLRGQTIERQVFAADPAKHVWKHPVTVVISNSTAGPAEVLAAALADNRRAQTVGERTFGTASEQKVIPLEDGGAIILTIANYYTPGGKSIPAEGVTPQVAVEEPAIGPEGPARVPVSEDLLVKKALEVLAKPVAPAATAAPKAALRVAPPLPAPPPRAAAETV